MTEAGTTLLLVNQREQPHHHGEPDELDCSVRCRPFLRLFGQLASSTPMASRSSGILSGPEWPSCSASVCSVELSATCRLERPNAFWVGTGAVGTAVVGLTLLGEPATVARLALVAGHRWAQVVWERRSPMRRERRNIPRANFCFVADSGHFDVYDLGPRAGLDQLLTATRLTAASGQTQSVMTSSLVSHGRFRRSVHPE